MNLRGAIVSLSKRIKMAIEIETGSLITEQVSKTADASTTQPKSSMFPPDSWHCRPSRTIRMYRDDDDDVAGLYADCSGSE